MEPTTASHKAYRRVDIETASQGKLIVMLFNGAIKRAEDAKRFLETGDMNEAHAKLLEAQDIVTELRSALNLEVGEVAQNLDRIYEYFHHLLVTANVKKDTGPLLECVRFMTTVRDAWQETFERLSREEAPEAPPAINRHGHSVMNLQG